MQTPVLVPYDCRKCGWSGAFQPGARRFCRECKKVREKNRRATMTPEERKANWEKFRERCRAERPDVWRRRVQRNRKRKGAKAQTARRMEWVRAGDVTAAQLRDLADRSGHRCHYCGEPVSCRFRAHWPRGFDHVVSRPNGGQHTISNMVVSCWPCNMKKR